MAAKEIGPDQGVLNLQVEKQAEVQGVGMGVLRDGTPFFNQRGLAALCGVQNAHIGTLDKDWNEENQKPRITIIKDLLAKRGAIPSSPSIEAKQNGRDVYAYPVNVCLAVIEYYALDAGANCQPEARENFRLLAGKGLQDFIYTQVGYDPNAIFPPEWRHFHDRVLLVGNKVPYGYFSVFREMADLIISLIHGGLPVDDKFLPDGSVGQIWSRYWVESNFDRNYGVRRQYAHSYPEYFRQSASNPQMAYCYPDGALGEFRRWMREVYLQENFGPYLLRKERKGELVESSVTLVLSAVRDDDVERLSKPQQK